MKNNLLIILLTVFFQSCGTDSGNPSMIPDSDRTSLSSFPIHEELCDIVKRCDSFAPANCSSIVLGQADLPELIGAREGRYLNLNELNIGLEKREVMLNVVASNQCISELRGLSCEDPLVASAISKPAEEGLPHIGKLFEVSGQCSRQIENTN